MNNTISKNLMSSIRRTGICFLALAAFGISSAYAQETHQDEETVKVRKVKKTASDYETRVVKGMNRYSTLTEKDSTYEVKIPNIVTYGDKEYRVTSIGENAFYNCSGLESVTIPNSVTSIGSSAFFGTAWYDKQPDGLVYAGKVAYRYKGTMPSGTNITLKEGTVGIADQSFYNCSTLTSVNIPESVTSIGQEAFSGCCNLNSVSIPNSVTSIGQKAFSGCCNLNSVSIPNSVTRIGGSAFWGCSGLTSVTIPNSVTSIEAGAFACCDNLTTIKVVDDNPQYDSRDNSNAIIETSTNTLICGCENTSIPNSVTCIGNSAFKGCAGLKSVTIGSGVTSIDDNAFSSCSNLISLTIPNGVTSIGEYAFYDCSSMSLVYCLAEELPTISKSAFYNSGVEYAILYVPAVSIKTYKSTVPWSSFGTILPIVEPVSITGDANGNGVVEIGDVTSVLTLMATPEAIGYDKKAADANGNGEIEIGDVTTILTIMAGN